MAEWTKAELLLANEQVLAATETRLAELKKGGALEAAYEATEDVAIEHTCQRNRALAALKVIIAHEDAAALELKRDLDMPDIELPWMQQAIAAIAACTEEK